MREKEEKLSWSEYKMMDSVWGTEWEDKGQITKPPDPTT